MSDDYSGRDAEPETYFARLAGDYARHRPSYPAAAVEAVVHGLGAAPRALDLGCGTGIFSRLLAAAGARVIGLDPGPEMLARAREAGGSPAYLRGRGEALPLGDGSCDLASCAQAFHWLDPGRALPELLRVLRPGGRLALVWNVRDLGAPACAAYEAFTARARAEAERRGRVVRHDRAPDPALGTWFPGARLLRFPHLLRYDWPALLGRARSTSYFPAAGPLREELERALRALFEEHARGGALELPHVCEVTLAERPA